jgi:hypothetical protein
MFYYNNETGQGDDTESLQMEGLEKERLETEDVKGLFIVYPCAAHRAFCLLERCSTC